MAALMFLGSLPAWAQQRTVLDGVFTPEQATRGESAYNANCAGCHRETLEGNAEALSLKGDRFIETWREDSLNALFTHMRTRMPRRPAGEPGSLKDSAYLEILTYILKQNGYPPGSSELTSGALKSTQLVARDGPRKLPANATIRTVGCFVAGPRSTWILANATAPVRTRNARETSPEELTESAALPGGTNTFRLQNLDDLRPGFMPEDLAGHKVQAKGVVTWQDKNDRIYVLSLESLSPECKPGPS
jgi:mono/diheme cytochrome c family protein